MTPKVKNPRKSAPIGVFDSGVGGLSILQELQKVLPHERFLFLADQAFVPYGAKSAPALKDRAKRITQFFLERDAKAVVIACNTATVYTIEHLRKTFTIPFIGTVPAIKPACRASHSRVIAVLSTPATAKSPALKELVRDFATRCKVVRIGCPGLEEAVEHGSLESSATRELLRKYLAAAQRAGADQLVLGCTHYPFLRKMIRSIYRVPTIDSGRAIARRTRSILQDNALLRPRGRGTVSYWTTGTPSRFSRVASQLLSRYVRARSILL